MDEELKKAFTDLQVKAQEMNQRVRVSEGQINSLKRDIAKAKLTKQELSTLPDGTKTYRAVGRMFILDSVGDISKDLECQEKEAEGRIKSIEEQVAYWQKNVKESEENIRDMLMHRRDK